MCFGITHRNCLHHSLKKTNKQNTRQKKFRHIFVVVSYSLNLLVVIVVIAISLSQLIYYKVCDLKKLKLIAMYCRLIILNTNVGLYKK